MAPMIGDMRIRVNPMTVSTNRTPDVYLHRLFVSLSSITFHLVLRDESRKRAITTKARENDYRSHDARGVNGMLAKDG